jgi:hypothetical protein
MRDKNYKLQITNDKQIPGSKIQITKKESPFGQVSNACGEQFSERTVQDRAIVGRGCQPPLATGGKRGVNRV